MVKATEYVAFSWFDSRSNLGALEQGGGGGCENMYNFYPLSNEVSARIVWLTGSHCPRLACERANPHHLPSEGTIGAEAPFEWIPRGNRWR